MGVLSTKQHVVTMAEHDGWAKIEPLRQRSCVWRPGPRHCFRRDRVIATDFSVSQTQNDVEFADVFSTWAPVSNRPFRLQLMLHIHARKQKKNRN